MNPNSKLKGMIDLRWNWVKELQDANEVKAVKVNTKDNVADLLTKCHNRITYNYLVDLVSTRAHEHESGRMSTHTSTFLRISMHACMSTYTYTYGQMDGKRHSVRQRHRHSPRIRHRHRRRHNSPCMGASPGGRTHRQII